MDFDRYEAIHKDLCALALELSRRKGADYSGTDDTLRNLKASAAFGVITAEQGVLVRIGDKLSRLWQLTLPGTQPAVADESFMDTIVDTVNYAILLAALRLEAEQEATNLEACEAMSRAECWGARE